MYGVSPAYFFSRFTTRFTVDDYAAGLSGLKSLGYECFQLEVFEHAGLGEWLRGVGKIRTRADDLGLKVSQFVAHFLLAAFRDEEALRSDYGLDEIEKVLDILSGFSGCDLVTVPLPAFAPEPGAVYDAARWRALRDRLAEKIRLMLSRVESASCRMALEIVPYSLIGGIAGFERFRETVGSEALGYNFDTGHAWSSKESIALIPARLGKSIFGTHLKDNFGDENLPLAPGKGSIPWAAVLGGLREAGYRGTFDVEIACAAEDVAAEYSGALNFLKEIRIASGYEYNLSNKE